MLCDCRYAYIMKDLNVFTRDYHENTLRLFLNGGFPISKYQTPPEYPELKWKPTISISSKSKKIKK